MQKTTAIYVIVLAILGASFALGTSQKRVVLIANLTFGALPTQLGDWKCVSHDKPNRTDKNTEEAVMETYVYQNAAGQSVRLILQATSSRLGVLRDWPTAQVGQGWTVGPPTKVELDAPGLRSPLVATERWLLKGPARTATISWYVSPTHQAASLAKAELLGWRDQILGRALWGGLYAQTISDASPEVMWQVVQDFTRVAGPQFQAILQHAQQTKGNGS